MSEFERGFLSKPKVKALLATWPDSRDEWAIRVSNEEILTRHLREVLLQDTEPAWVSEPIDPRMV